MTSSTRCSSRRVARGLALAAALLAGAGCARHAVQRPGGSPGFGLDAGERPRIVLLPIDNLAGGAAPTRELQVEIEVALRRRFELVTGDILEEFLGRHRIRYTGGIDAEIARAVRDELGADAVLVTSLELYRAGGPPALGLAMRLVSTGDEPVILWMDAAARAGDESPGLLRLGMIDSIRDLQARVIERLARGLSAFADGKRARSPQCGGTWYGPKVRFRSSLLDESRQATLAVIPFLNEGGRRSAGESVALEFVRHLVSSGQFRVLEPGVVRDYLLRARVMMPGGVSLETTRLMLGALDVDLVLSGVVLDYDDSPGMQGPMVRFTATMLDGGSGEVVWNSGSYNRGDDGVFAFGLGRVRTSTDLTCRMVGDVIAALGRRGANTPVARDEDPRRARLDAVQARVRRNAGSGDGKAPR